MPEECTSSSHDKQQLVVQIFYAQFDLMKVTRPITLYPITLMDKNNSNKHVTTTNGGK